MTLLWVVLSLALLAGCSWQRTEARNDGFRDLLASVQSAGPVQAGAAAPSDVADALAAYQRVYREHGAALTAETDYAVARRVADLAMLLGEAHDLDARPEPYAAAITYYQALLARADVQDRDALHYQLARAFELSGQPVRAAVELRQLLASHPASSLRHESRFRLAEMAFLDGDYPAAADDYLLVAAEAGGGLALNASYMHGWSLYRAGQYQAALTRFLDVVDVLSLRGETAPAEAELLDDALRVLVLSLGHIGGQASLVQAMADHGRPAWQTLVYDRYAEHMRAQSRYLDAVATLEAFSTNNTTHPQAPAYDQRAIELLLAAGFPSEVLVRRETFVERYGVHSSFWARHAPADPEVQGRLEWQDWLHDHLVHLATVTHARAQADADVSRLRQAAHWYQQLIASFPADNEAAEWHFLLAEAYAEAGDAELALPAYQWVARAHRDQERAAEAAYAAILMLNQLIAAHSGTEAPADVAQLAVWRETQLREQIDFSLSYPEDPRRPAVQLAAADRLFLLGRYQQALGLAQPLSELSLAANQRQSLWLIIGHSQYELGQYAAAERAYLMLLDDSLPAAEVDAPDPAELSWHERLLASIYRQAEAAEAAGDVDAAVRHYLRIADIAPGSQLAVSGHFDAVAALESASRFAEAARRLDAFRSAYGAHALAVDATLRLATLHERAGSMQQAAAEYERLGVEDNDPERRRQALFRAAELHADDGRIQRARAVYEDYVARYPMPLDLQIEAVERLLVIASQSEDAQAQQHWRQHLVHAALDAGDAASGRLLYLASEAQLAMALEARAAFSAVQLRHPLADSLSLKQQRLDRALRAFETLAQLEVQGYQSAATYHIAQLYADLSQALINSERPAGLNALELDQYEILLEEEAFPFEELAIELHEVNVQRSWDGVYDDWVARSFTALGELMPARFAKTEVQVGYADRPQ